MKLAKLILGLNSKVNQAAQTYLDQLKHMQSSLCSGVLLLNRDFWASRSIPAYLCNNWSRSGQYCLHCGFCKSQNTDVNKKKMYIMLATLYLNFVLRYSPSSQLFLVERMGRRPLHLIGLMGMAVSAVFLTVAMLLFVSVSITFA